LALHITQAQMQTLLALTVGALKPQQLFQIVDALDRIQYVAAPDSSSSFESTLTTIFPSTAPNF
jgi:hypothetical protein